MKRKKLILGILLLGLTGALVYAYLATPRQQRVASVAKARPEQQRRSPAAAKSQPAAEGRLRLDLLERPKASFPGYKRDIFGSWQVVPPRPKSPPVVKAPPPPPPPPRTLPTAPPRFVEPVRRQPLARFSFLGFLEKEGSRIVFLSRDNELFVVKSGERFGQKKEFLVTAITDEKMTIEQQGIAGVITVPLIEEKPLRQVFKAGRQPAPMRRPVAPFVPPPVAPRPEAGLEAENEDDFEELSDEEGAPEPKPALPGLRLNVGNE